MYIILFFFHIRRSGPGHEMKWTFSHCDCAVHILLERLRDFSLVFRTTCMHAAELKRAWPGCCSLAKWQLVLYGGAKKVICLELPDLINTSFKLRRSWHFERKIKDILTFSDLYIMTWCPVISFLSKSSKKVKSYFFHHFFFHLSSLISQNRNEVKIYPKDLN